jgi:hypothetical protein
MLFLSVFIVQLQICQLLAFSVPNNALKLQKHVQSWGYNGGSIEMKELKFPFRAVFASFVGISTIFTPVADVLAANGNNKVGAGELFEKSSIAFKSAETAYKSMENSFSSSKRHFDNIYRQELKTLQIFEDMSRVQSSLMGLSSAGEGMLQKIQSETDGLSDSVSQKYLDAEASAASLAKPQVTASLFNKAQQEAQILEEEKKQLLFLKQTNLEIQRVSNQLQLLLQQLKTTDTNAQSTLKEQQRAMDLMQQGIVHNLEVCRYNTNHCAAEGKTGVQEFDLGNTALRSSQDKYLQLLKMYDTQIK